MPMVEFSDSDLLRNKIVVPAWYRLDLGVVSEWTPSKDQKSNNLTIECIILFDADSGDKEFAGVPVTIRFNDSPKVRGFIEGFLRGLGIDVSTGRYDIGKAAGMQIDAFVKVDMYEGRQINKVDHKYRQVKS